MSLETKIETLTAAVVALTAAIQSQQGATAVVPQVVPQAAPAPVAPAAPTFVPPAAPAPAPEMPALPSFAAPVAPAAPAQAAPFNDGAGLVKYVMEAYQALGQEKGAQIGNILTALGYGNINDVKPEHYATFHAQVEALKAA